MISNKHEISKIMVVHAGSRDGYEVVSAFEDYESFLVTDFYYNQKSIFGKIAWLIWGKEVFRRHRNDTSFKVRGSVFLLCLDLVGKVLPQNRWLYRLRGKGLAKLALRTAHQEGITHAIVYYSSGAQWIFENLPSACCKILFQMHPHPKKIVDIYQSYISERPTMLQELTAEEEEMSKHIEYVKELSAEAQSADYVICTTSFVSQSLEEAGVISENCIVIPYGSSPTNCSEVETVRPASSGIRLAFVGQFVVRKGVYELVEAMQNRPSDLLTIFTRDKDSAHSKISKWFGEIPANIEIEKIPDSSKLWKRASEHDFLILPSLVEGFGLVLIEAMSHGLPIIATRNTAAPDLLKESKAGILLKGYMSKDIDDGIQRALSLRAEWPAMRQNAKQFVQQRTWNKFRKELISAFESFETKSKP